MRLIDADKLLYDDIDCKDGHTYMIVHAPEIDKQPTVEVPQWIPCSERLPEVCGLGVLLTIENKFQQRKAIQGFTGYMEGGKLEFHTNDKCTNLEVWRVIAWQPLPSVWKGENNAEK